MGDTLVCKGKLIGLFNGGDLCNVFQTYGAYTNVELYRQLILDTIKKNTNPQKIADDINEGRDDEGSSVNHNHGDDDFGHSGSWCRMLFTIFRNNNFHFT